jgi:pSer/pThr/pTyr-binding forkhead associated (FHA) protein/tetratricopeptide (TPR) repeat protein
MYKLVISDDEGKTIIVPLVRDLITVGRQDGNTIRLTERNVSRQHARLVRNGQGYRIEDLDSYNGVVVNGTRIDKAVDLRDGDRVGVGDYIIALKSEADAPAPQPPQPPRSPLPAALPGSPPARLVMVSAPAPGAEFSLAKPLIRIGRLEELDLCISHRSISREHARVTARDGGFEVEDLKSANGVRINGSSVKRALLRSGDVVELGQVRFRFVAAGESYNFDPTEEEQLAALPAADGGPKKSTILAVIASAAMLGAALALLDQESTPAGAANRERVIAEAPVVTSTSIPRPESAQEPSEDLGARCAAAVSAGRFTEAMQIAENGLSHGADSALSSCKAQADAALRAETAYGEGKAALAKGELEDAYFLFAGIPDDSAYRSKPEIVETTRRVAEGRLSKARKELKANPAEAKHLANSVLEMRGLAAASMQEAERIVGLAGASRASSGAAAPPATQPKAIVRAPVASAEPEEKESPAKAARACLARGDQRCAVKALEGHADNAQELALLIETYRALGDTKKAVKHMETFVERFPSARQAPQYRQFITKHE